MKIATILSVHKGPEVVVDTLDSVRTWIGDKVLMLVDGAHWDWAANMELPAVKLKGFYHDLPKSPYRNVTLGLMHAQRLWPDMDWYCYCEYDVLFTSSAFKSDLEDAAKRGVWLLGNDYNEGNIRLPLLEKMMKTKFDGSKYLLGCCLFHRGDFLRKLAELNFFDRFLFWTNPFSGGFFPDYDAQGGYDVVEHLYPTLAHHFGGKVESFANYHRNSLLGPWWGGNFRKYPMRWQPTIDPEKENFPEACVFHPLKLPDHPIRLFHKIKRQRINRIKNEKNQFSAHNFGFRGGCKLEKIQHGEVANR